MKCVPGFGDIFILYRQKYMIFIDLSTPRKIWRGCKITEITNQTKYVAAVDM